MRGLFKLKLFGLVASLGLLLISGCGDRFAGSEIGNPTVALTGTALYPDGKPAGGAKVLLRRKDYLAEDAGRALLPIGTRTSLGKKSAVRSGAFTDNQGRFKIDSVDLGDYRIEINDGMHQGLLLDCSVNGKTNTVLPTDTLRPTAVVTGTVKWETPPDWDYVALVFGLERAAFVDPTSGKFIIEDCPAGSYNFRIGCLGQGCLSKDMENIKVKSGDSLMLDTLVLSTFAAEDYSHWLHSLKIQVNTSASGASIADTQSNFPLLVRLDTSNFDFSTADSKGRDIRFTNGKGDHLHFEIERWDRLEKKAEIWVRVDTILALNSSQALKMYWGNGEAAAYSAGARVFAIQDGYRGVWHLGETGSATPNAYRDATAFGNHGTGEGMSPTSDISGVMGHGQNFNQNASILIPADSSLHSGSALTLELWVELNSTGSFKRIISKAFTESRLPWTEYDIETDSVGNSLAFSLGIGGNLVSVHATTKLLTKHWYHVVATFDGVSQSLYMDGVLEASKPRSGIISDYGRPVTLGKYERDNVSTMDGNLDEVRISGIPKSASWIKLSYENQRLDSHLMTFLPVVP
jgi:hypothetical protein